MDDTQTLIEVEYTNQLNDINNNLKELHTCVNSIQYFLAFIVVYLIVNSLIRFIGGIFSGL